MISKVKHKLKRKAALSEKYIFTVLFEPAPEGGYVVRCPALPGVVTEGDTLKKAREMAKDAIELYLEDLIADGLPVPQDRTTRLNPVKENLSITLKSA